MREWENKPRKEKGLTQGCLLEDAAVGNRSIWASGIFYLKDGG